MRSLASIRVIDGIQSIPGADNIELAIFGGWQAVVKKGLYEVGYRVVFCEIDSFLPPLPEYAFLGKTKKMADGREGYLIRSKNIRKNISQGLVLPLTLEMTSLPTGTDVSDVLNIIKYEEPMPPAMQAKAQSNWPSFMPKTDQERVQNIRLPSTNHPFQVTEKLDGMSCTMFLNGDTFGVCSRNFLLKTDAPSTFLAMVEKYEVERLLRALNKNIALQGEIIGEGIQSNPYKLIGQYYYVYDVYDIDRRAYVSPHEAQELIEDLGLHYVPVLEEITLAFRDVDNLIKLADGASKLNENYPREGIVFKSVFGRVSFKSISNKYLLKTER